VRPPPSPAQIRFPAVSERTPGFPRHSRGPDRRFPSLWWERTNRGAETPPGLWLAQTLSRQILCPRTETVRMSTETGSHSWPARTRRGNAYATLSRPRLCKRQGRQQRPRSVILSTLGAVSNRRRRRTDHNARSHNIRICRSHTRSSTRRKLRRPRRQYQPRRRHFAKLRPDGQPKLA
jgi:hypothetical protein